MRTGDEVEDIFYYAYAYNNPIVLKDLDGHEPGDYWDSWEYSGWANGYGNMVSIYNTEGTYQGLNMRYAHMNAPSPLTVSSTVSAGDFIGMVGNSGTQATHLHIDAGYGIFTPRADRINLDPLFIELYP